MTKRTFKKCEKCDKKSLPGFISGRGFCQYHWAEAIWGTEWAKKEVKNGII